MKFFLNESIHPLAVERLQSRGEIIGNLDDLADVDAVIVRITRVTREMMQQAKKLKVIGKHGIGCDNIDIEAARELGIRVVYTPLANVNSVAELIVAFFLAASRHLFPATQGVRESRFATISPAELTGLEIRDKVIGLVGLGRIAFAVAGILGRGFQARLIGYDPFVPAETAAEAGIRRYEHLEEMLAAADYVSLSVPLTEATRNLIGARQLNCLRPSAILVNTSRGGIVDEAALYEALKAGKLRGAASDVFVREPPGKENPLISLPNFIATPHIGANTEEAMYRMGMTVVEEVLAVLEGGQPRYPVV